MDETPGPPSEASSQRERYLAALIETLESRGWLPPEQFLDRFPPTAIMQALANEPELRANILVGAIAAHERIAAKKCVESAAEDLELALEEGVVDAETLLGCFPATDRGRCLEAAALWELVTSHVEQVAAGRHRVIELAMEQGLVSHRDVFDGLTVDEIAATLTPEELRAVVAHGLRAGRKDHPLDEARFLEVVSLESLLQALPPEHVWERVIVGKIAEPLGLHATAAPTDAEAAPPTDASPHRTDPDATDEPEYTQFEIPTSDEIAEALDEDELLSETAFEPPESPPFELQARERVIEALDRIHRLPPRHDRLSLANLLSLESMYAELANIEDEAGRELCVRDSFPNDDQLREALVLLLEVLDPTIDTTEAVIRDADADTLTKLVVLEERLLREREARRSRPRLSAPPPPPSRRSSVMPASSPPPPPGSIASKPLPPPPRRASVPPPPPSRRSSVPPPPPSRVMAPASLSRHAG